MVKVILLQVEAIDVYVNENLVQLLLDPCLGAPDFPHPVVRISQTGVVVGFGSLCVYCRIYLQLPSISLRGTIRETLFKNPLSFPFLRECSSLTVRDHASARLTELCNLLKN